MTDSDLWNDTLHDDQFLREVKCHRCYGTGEDEVGADCLECLGYGTLLE